MIPCALHIMNGGHIHTPLSMGSLKQILIIHEDRCLSCEMFYLCNPRKGESWLTQPTILRIAHVLCCACIKGC